MQSERRDLATVVGALSSDILSVFGIPAGMAQSLLAQHLSRKAGEARAILMDELRKGCINDFEAAAADEVIGAIYSYLLAARDNAARLNLRLLAKAILGQLQRHCLFADEFQRHKDILSRITPDQALVLGCCVRLMKQTREEVGAETETGSASEKRDWTYLRDALRVALVPEQIRSVEGLEAICAQSSGLGLLIPQSAWNATVYVPSPLLMELVALVDFEDAVRCESESRN